MYLDTKKHEWLFAELAELKYYLNSVNSNSSNRILKSDSFILTFNLLIRNSMMISGLIYKSHEAR